MAGLRVLVADADRKFSERARKALTAAGHEVLVAKSHAEALELIGERELDAVVAAAKLPGGSGHELCRTVKLERDATIPCVLLVDADGAATREAVAGCGAENYLVRPAGERELLYAVRELATLRHLKQRLVELRVGAPDAAALDPQTGFRTFAYFKEVLFSEVKRARRYGYPVSLLLASFDAGPALEQTRSADLRRQLFGGFAVAVRQCMRDYDIGVAYGDGEVLVLMPHTDHSGAAVVARRIREAIARSALKVDGRALRASVSVGVASSEASGADSFSELVREAKRTMQSSARRPPRVARAS
ncbi:MAG: diguanylate cyclase [Myxococcales bacterium]